MENKTTFQHEKEIIFANALQIEEVVGVVRTKWIVIQREYG